MVYYFSLSPHVVSPSNYSLKCTITPKKFTHYKKMQPHCTIANCLTISSHEGVLPTTPEDALFCHQVTSVLSLERTSLPASRRCTISPSSPHEGVSPRNKSRRCTVSPASQRVYCHTASRIRLPKRQRIWRKLTLWHRHELRTSRKVCHTSLHLRR